MPHLRIVVERISEQGEVLNSYLVRTDKNEDDVDDLGIAMGGALNAMAGESGLTIEDAIVAMVWDIRGLSMPFYDLAKAWGDWDGEQNFDDFCHVVCKKPKKEEVSNG